MKKSFLTIVLAMISVCAFADSTNVTLHIGFASAARLSKIVNQVQVHTDNVTFSCAATLDNKTGAPLTVTGFHSPFDSMSLVVLDTNGNEVARIGYADAFSSDERHSFTLVPGTAMARLTFPLCRIPDATQSVMIRIEGRLPDSSITGSITSNVAEVKIRE